MRRPSLVQLVLLVVVVCLAVTFVTWWHGPTSHARTEARSRVGRGVEDPTEATGEPSPLASGDRAADPETAARLHAGLEALLRARAVAPDPETKNAPAPTPRTDDEFRDYVMEATAHESTRVANQCIEATLARDPEVSGTVSLFVTLSGSPGSATVVSDLAFLEDEIHDPSFRACVDQQIRAFTFDPPPSSFGDVRIQLPIRLAPTEVPLDPEAEGEDTETEARNVE